MLQFQIDAMTCSHCVRAVTEAIQEVDAQARVAIDLPTHRVSVDSTADQAVIVVALTEAGYPPA